MRVFVAGATGAVGCRLIPLLARAGHAVLGLTRTPAKQALVREFGAEPFVADALDATAIHAAIRTARPDVIVHELTDLKGVSDLRKFAFYGPDTGMFDAAFAAWWSFLHIDDAAEATALAVERGRGVYNVVDDPPAPVHEWLPAVAGMLGAKPPVHIPAWLARLVGGEHLVVMMTDSRAGSNAKARRELSWRPLNPSWRQGFEEIVQDESRLAA
jgi:nucleoside-diphosphate-sugar epimerase